MEEILRTLVAFQTVSGDATAAHQALDYVASFVTKRGMHVARYDSDGFESLVATVRPDHKTPKVILAAHLDVVPAPSELFELRQEDGKFYGRGVLDMKGALAAYLQIIDELQDTPSQYDFGLMVTTDEELGGKNGAEKLVEEGYAPSVCILPDGGDNWQIQLHSKGFLYVKVVVRGKPAHGSRPWLGHNANLVLLNIIHEVHALFPDSGLNTNTLNIGLINGGSAANQVADYAEATLDIRVISEAERQRLLVALKRICEQHNAQLTVELNGAVGEFSLENEYIAPFAKLITEVTGVKVVGSRTLGSNDARFFAAKNIPCISFYPTGGGHHGPEEWLSAEALVQLKQIIQTHLEKTNK
ncbi:MAG TPA: M20/M25/M40 family metallo-hydrolase [Candidatus Saccharimonadales bacterium]|nr:M20/M25/M40 family metallo-hydrolase [Candidatus Saccharimonadales bacterium]